MSQGVKTTANPNAAGVEVITRGDASLVIVSGLVDERFTGFGEIYNAKSVVIDVSKISRMTSFGVRQWLRVMTALSKSITDLYLLGCPTFFVDQLNMVLNFGGGSKVLTVMAPFACPSCGVESAEVVDVLAERASLTKGALRDKQCSRCGGKLELDETLESYFAFATKYGASVLQPAAAELLARDGRYVSQDAVVDAVAEKPPRIIKLVHGNVTYFRIIGTLGARFRARPFLVGTEGEVVIDVAEVERFDPAGHQEWRRLLKNLAGQVAGVTLVDVTESFLSTVGESVLLARNIAVASMLMRYCCSECGRKSQESVDLINAEWPPTFEDKVCTTCGGTHEPEVALGTLGPLQRASTTPAPESVKVFRHRSELLSRALTDASVAQGAAAGEPSANDTILGKYKIMRKLSAGGMAEVFLAKQVGLGGFEKLIAIKRIQHKMLESRREAIELFLNEAKIAGRLMHPNIVQVLDVGEVGGALYLAMEFVHGRDLRDIAKQLRATNATMDVGEACYIAREVAQALHHAYWSTDMAGNRLSVVHRDVSPHNILLGYDGTVKLLDFGVAMSAVTEHARLIVGKWTYMSPETTLNGQTDHRSDLFSLGVILYLLCTGVPPFSSSDPRVIVKKIRAGDYKPLGEVAPHVPERLAKLVGRMLAVKPEHRPQRGQEVVDELNAIMRQERIDTSAAVIASLVGRLFPSHDDIRLTEVVRVHPDEPVATTVRVKSDPSITPSAGTSSHVVDISQTFQRQTPTDFAPRPTPTGLAAPVRPTPTNLAAAVRPAPTNLAAPARPTRSRVLAPSRSAERQLPAHPSNASRARTARFLLALIFVVLVAVAAYFVQTL
jgi:serine/threonine protein kinase